MTRPVFSSERGKWRPRLSWGAVCVLCSFMGALLPVRISAAEAVPCRSETFEGDSFTVCEVDLRQDIIRLFWRERDGRPYNFLQAPYRRGWTNNPGRCSLLPTQECLILILSPLVSMLRRARS